MDESIVFSITGRSDDASRGSGDAGEPPIDEAEEAREEDERPDANLANEPEGAGALPVVAAPKSGSKTESAAGGAVRVDAEAGAAGSGADAGPNNERNGAGAGTNKKIRAPKAE